MVGRFYFLAFERSAECYSGLRIVLHNKMHNAATDHVGSSCQWVRPIFVPSQNPYHQHRSGVYLEAKICIIFRFHAVNLFVIMVI